MEAGIAGPGNRRKRGRRARRDKKKYEVWMKVLCFSHDASLANARHGLVMIYHSCLRMGNESDDRLSLIVPFEGIRS